MRDGISLPALPIVTNPLMGKKDGSIRMCGMKRRWHLHVCHDSNCEYCAMSDQTVRKQMSDADLN